MGCTRCLPGTTHPVGLMHAHQRENDPHERRKHNGEQHFHPADSLMTAATTKRGIHTFMLSRDRDSEGLGGRTKVERIALSPDEWCTMYKVNGRPGLPRHTAQNQVIKTTPWWLEKDKETAVKGNRACLGDDSYSPRKKYNFFKSTISP